MTDKIQGDYKDRSFFSKNVALDGSSFRDCVFSSCTMIYSGGEVPALSGCRFDDCGWQFTGDAANTIAFLSGMYRGGFDQLIEATFHEIRRGAVIGQPVAAKQETRTSFPTASLLKPLRIFRVPKQEQ
ncbi:MAG: hypothetical protein ABJN75_11095 [Hoeflea sp.]|uniref:hypothetical protein n=1 Tax=Hoeflea sp. TaxID=1940281 RepID=UPI0032997DC2|tara:strand:- start:12553 stop:12936 length:384 start_codon:yes stop_codon:yes gene_type:complete